MRLLAIATLYPLSPQDTTGQHRHTSFRVLRDLGHEVEVFRCQCRLPAVFMPRDWRRKGRLKVPRMYTMDGIRVSCPRFWRLPGMWCRPYEGAWRYKVVAPVAREMHRAKPFDAVYGAELTPDGVVAVLLAKELDLPVMVSSIGSDAHTYPYFGHAFMTRTQWVLREANLVIVESEGAIEPVRKLVPDIVDIRVFNRGINLEPFRLLPEREQTRRRLGLPEDRRLIVYLGRLIEGKGMRPLIGAFAKLHDRFPDVELALVGAGPMNDWISQQAEGTPWASRVHLLGRRPYNEVPGILHACDIFCLPTYAEGLPKSIIEAMASGLPVVATAVGGIPDVVHHGSTGLLIPPRDEAALHSALAEVLENPDRARRMGAAARELAYEKFDARKNALDLLAFTEEALSRFRAVRGLA